MNCEQFSKNQPNPDNYVVVDDSPTVELNTSPIDIEPFPPMENTSENQRDSLSVDNSLEDSTSPSTVCCPFRHGNTMAYNTFSNYHEAVELGGNDDVPKCTDQFYDMEPTNKTSTKLDEIIGYTSAHHVDEIPSMDTRSKPIPSQIDDDDIILIEDDADILRELALQLQQKIEERKRAAAELRQKRAAENVVAKTLVRKVLELDPDYNFLSELKTAQQRREAKNVEAAVARQLVLLVSRGAPLEETIPILKATASSNFQRLNTIWNEEHSAGYYGAVEVARKPQTMVATPVPDEQPIQQSFARRRLSYCSEAANSTDSDSNSHRANERKRPNPDEHETPRPHWIEETSSKQARQKSTRHDVNDYFQPSELLPEPSSSAASMFQPLPSCTPISPRLNYHARTNIYGNVAEEQVQSGQRYQISQDYYAPSPLGFSMLEQRSPTSAQNFPMSGPSFSKSQQTSPLGSPIPEQRYPMPAQGLITSQQRFPTSRVGLPNPDQRSPVSPQRLPIAQHNFPMSPLDLSMVGQSFPVYQPSSYLPPSSSVSGVHPSHLVPPDLLFGEDLDDFIDEE